MALTLASSVLFQKNEGQFHILAYVTDVSHALIDRQLYLPQSWTNDRERSLEAGIPESVAFQTKCELARQMVERVWRLQIPIAWVVADTVYGNDEVLRDWLETHRYWYVLAVDRDEPVNLPTAAGRKRMMVHQVETQVLKKQDWQRLSMGKGTKGPRLFDWAVLPILHRGVADGQHFLLIRRPLDTKKPKKTTYYFVFAPAGTTLAEMVKALGARWHIEEIFEAAKGMGMGDYEVRSWIGWHRHMTLVMLAYAYLSVVCAQENATTTASVWSQAAVSAGRSEPKKTADPPELQPDSFTSPRLSLTAPIDGNRSLLFDPLAPLAVPLQLAPLTVPGARYLLGRLIWPLPCNSTLVLDWSDWRRKHRRIASESHTKRRKIAIEVLEAASRASP